uniref:Cuticular protein n=2 Tax=Nilaparvata lugens TaxID=108931 RepID=A0A2S1ZSB1_NILLU|nr:cuticular protein [Nilaparvata lugens]
MAAYQIAFVALMMAVHALAQYHHAPAYHHEEEHYAPPKYEFEYAVKDDHTYDIKSQKEARDGDHVTGVYTLLQPDGRTRIVEYSSDKKTGFIANVHYEGEAKPYAPAPKYAAAPSYAAPKYAPAPAYAPHKYY